MKLSKNFTLEEMVATSHKRLQDTPTLDVVQNLQKLCVLVGVPNSRHLQGRAADIHCDNLDYAKVIFDILRQNPNVDKVIIERKGHSVWVHVQM